MRGNIAYEQKIENKISRVLNRHDDRNYLKGFKFFLMTGVSINTVYNYVDAVDRFMDYLEDSAGKISPENLKLEHYTEYMTYIKGKSSSYQITVYTALKKFSEYLAASGINSLNPMQYVSRPKEKDTLEARERRDNGFLTEDEITMYLNAVKNYNYEGTVRYGVPNWRTRDLLIIFLLLSTGMRCSAMYKLDLSNINLTNRTLFTVDKGDKIHEYRLPENVVSAILDYLTDRENVLKERASDTEALFINQYCNRLDQQGISAVVKKFASAVPGKTLTPHKLRATYGTQLYEKTHDLYFVQQCMGHSSPKITETYIRGTGKETAQKASDIIENILF